MKAAVVTAPGATPTFADFPTPAAREGLESIEVLAAAMSQLTRSRAAGSHYSSSGQYPFVAGVDGVGTTADGRCIYFAMPEAPFGAMAEYTLVDPDHTVPVPSTLDAVAAAALANPGMSCWAALVERAHLQPGETVLINGATGAAGTVAVQVAKHLGAGKIIVTGRNEEALQALRQVGADVVLPFDLRTENPLGAAALEQALRAEFVHGLDVVVDYLWGTSARAIIVAIAKSVEDAHPVRFIQVGEASREAVELPGAALRSSAIQIMGSGLKSVPFPRLLEAVRQTFHLAAEGKLKLATRSAPLSEVGEHWDAPGTPRVVYTLRS